MKTKIYATIKNRKGEDVTKQVSVAILDSGRVSARKFNSIMRIAAKEFDGFGNLKGVKFFTEDGKICNFRGYPVSEGFVMFL